MPDSESSTIHVLTFPSQVLLDVTVTDFIPNQDIQRIWSGKCLEDPELTFVVLAGCPDDLDPVSLFKSLTPKLQQCTQVSIASLIECLNAPVTEVASTTLKTDCDYARATSLIDAAMQTVLDADDCVAAVWKTNDKEAAFFVGWRFLQAHEKYHQKIFANPPDCITELSSIVDTSVVFHVVFRQIHSTTNIV